MSLLSVPKLIFETDSPYNGHIQIIDVGSTRKIVVDKISQSVSPDSPSAQRMVWGQLVDVIKTEEPEGIQSVLILGLGGGTMQHLLSRTYPEANIVSVEIDQVMVDVATNYFGVMEIPHHRVIVEDALRVVVSPTTYGLSEFSFDVVVVDIYIGEDFPELGSSGNFIAAVKKLVAPGGLLVFNRIYLDYHQEDVHNFIDNLELYVQNVQSRTVAGHTNSDNIIIYGRV